MSPGKQTGFTTEDLLILTKTYPTPSHQYRETTCVAALTQEGELRRLFPIPFRLLAGDDRFKRWEWVRMKLSRKTSDVRPESRKIEIDSIVRRGDFVDTSGDWTKRLELIEQHKISDPDALEERRKATGETLGFIEPVRCISLEIAPVGNPEWTAAEVEKLRAEGLFDTAEARARTLLRKLPVDFHYRYECETLHGRKEFRHKVTDWEFGALYWNCMNRHGPNGWESAFRDKVERDFFSSRRMLFLLGTMRFHPHRWLLVGVVYPPKPQGAAPSRQLDLRLDP